MIREELYNKTVDILYQAYFNDTLEHSNCYACAVGNLIAANLGRKLCVDPTVKEQKFFWEDYAPYSRYDGKQAGWFPLDNPIPEPDFDIEVGSTGYSVKELIKIERAFENANEVDGSTGDDVFMFNGLVAVLDVLREIHQVTDEDLITGNNKRFKDHYNKKVRALV